MKSRRAILYTVLALFVLVAACKQQSAELPGAAAMPGPAYLASLLGTDGGSRLLNEGYTFAGYYDQQHTMPGYVRQLGEQWQAVVLLTPGHNTVMAYDKQLAAVPYPYADMAARLKTYLAEERSLLPDTDVVTFRASILDSIDDSTTAMRHYTSRSAFHAAAQAYLANADSVALHRKVITTTTTGTTLSVTIEFARQVGQGLTQTSLTVARPQNEPQSSR